MNEPKPIVPVNPEGLDDVLKSLLEEGPNLPPSESPSGSNIRNAESYIILPGKVHGSYSYPDLLVAAHRLSYDAEVERAAKRLGLNLQNSATENNGNQYIGNVNWEQALKLNLLLGNFTLNPRQFIDFVQLLKSGLETGKVYDGKGEVLPTREVNTILDEILTKRDPWRAEWLDAYFFTDVNGKTHINYEHRNVNGQLKPQRDEPLENCVMEDTYVNLFSANRQGLPTSKSNTQETYFWYPKDKRVAGFRVDSGGVGLGCDGGPAGSVASLGVRPARLK